MPAPQDRIGFLDGGADTRSFEFRAPAGELLVQVQTWTDRDRGEPTGDCTTCGWEVRGDDRDSVDTEAKAHFDQHLDGLGMR